MGKIYHTNITVRLPVELVQRIDKRCKKLSISRNQFCLQAIEMLLNSIEGTEGNDYREEG